MRKKQPRERRKAKEQQCTLEKKTCILTEKENGKEPKEERNIYVRENSKLYKNVVVKYLLKLCNVT